MLKSSSLPLLLIFSILIGFSCCKNFKSESRIAEEMSRYDTMDSTLLAKVIDSLSSLKKEESNYLFLAKAYRMRGDARADLGLSDYFKAVALFDQYRKKRNLDRIEEAELLNYLGYYYQSIAFDPAKSNKYFIASNKLNKEAGKSRAIEIAKNLSNLALNELIGGNLKTVGKLLNEAEKIFNFYPITPSDRMDRLGFKNMKGNYHKLIADSLFLIGELKAATKEAREAKSLYLSNFKELKASINQENIGFCVLSAFNLISCVSGRSESFTSPGDTIQYYSNKILSISPQTKKTEIENKLAPYKALMFSYKGNHVDAINLIEKIFNEDISKGRYDEITVNPINLEHPLNSLMIRNMIKNRYAQTSRSALNFREAIKSSKENLGIVVKKRKSLVKGASQEMISIENHTKPELALDNVFGLWMVEGKDTVNPHAINEGLEILAIQKGQLLKQQLQNVRIKQIGSYKDKNSPAYWDFYFQNLMNDTEGAEKENSEAVQRYNHFKDTLKFSTSLASRAYYIDQFIELKPTINDVRRLLPSPRSAYVEYQTFYQHSYVIVITKKYAKMFELPIDQKFRRCLDKYQLSKASYSNGYDGTFAQLYNYLVLPIKSFLDANSIDELVLVPDNNLSDVVFEGLFSSPGGDQSNLLVHNYAMSYHYSLSSWMLQAQIEMKKKGTEKNVGAFIATPSNDESYWAACGSSSLPKLNKMSRQLNKGTNDQVFLNCTRNKFIKESKHFRILQMTMHGCYDENKGEPYLVFAPGKIKDRLYMKEIYEQQINAQLVVMASCFTADGEAGSFEGAKSIARAFLFSGCPRVIAGINKVSDESSAEILKSFYHYLDQNHSPTKALQKAKLDYIKAHPSSHPNLWTSLVFIGDPRWQN